MARFESAINVNTIKSLTSNDALLHLGADNRVGIVAVGKSYVDTLTAMQKLGITTDDVGLYKVGIAWPLHEEHLINFCTSYQNILVFEEKYGLVEDQLYKLLYNKQN